MTRCPNDHRALSRDPTLFAELAYVGVQRDAVGRNDLELRNCNLCGSTISRIVRREQWRPSDGGCEVIETLIALSAATEAAHRAAVRAAEKEIAAELSKLGFGVALLLARVARKEAAR